MFSSERIKRFKRKYELVRMLRDDGINKEAALVLVQAVMEYEPDDESKWAAMFAEVGLSPELAPALTYRMTHRELVT